MALQKESPEYIEAKQVSKPSQKGIRVISAMSTPRILWFVVERHNSGLKTLAILGLASYITYDKVIKYFV